MSATISFNQKSYKNFLNHYETAVKNNETIFTFEGNEFLTSYAKYMIEYLNQNFK